MIHTHYRPASRDIPYSKQYMWLPACFLGFVFMVLLIAALLIIVDYCDDHAARSVSEQIKPEPVTNTCPAYESLNDSSSIKDSKRKFGVGYQLNGKLGYGDKSLMLYSF